MSNQAAAATSAPSASKRQRLIRPLPLPAAEVTRREVVFNMDSIHVNGRRQPNLQVSFTCFPPPTRDSAVQATTTVKDCSTQVSTTEIDKANKMQTLIGTDLTVGCLKSMYCEERLNKKNTLLWPTTWWEAPSLCCMQ